MTFNVHPPVPGCCFVSAQHWPHWKTCMSHGVGTWGKVRILSCFRWLHYFLPLWDPLAVDYIHITHTPAAHTHTHTLTMRCNLIKDLLQFVGEVYKISIEPQQDIQLGSSPELTAGIPRSSCVCVCVCLCVLFSALLCIYEYLYSMFASLLLLLMFTVCINVCLYVFLCVCVCVCVCVCLWVIWVSDVSFSPPSRS